MRSDIEHPPPSSEQGSTVERTEAALTKIATLQPTQVPGRLTRKARHYLPQIIQLRAQGYTLEAIQQALAAVGVAVSISTVRRESVRPLPPALPSVAVTGAAGPIASARTTTAFPPAASTSSAASPVIPALQDSGKDIAAAYAHTKSSNALTRAKERS